MLGRRTGGRKSSDAHECTPANARTRHRVHIPSTSRLRCKLRILYLAENGLRYWQGSWHMAVGVVILTRASVGYLPAARRRPVGLHRRQHNRRRHCPAVSTATTVASVTAATAAAVTKSRIDPPAAEPANRSARRWRTHVCAYVGSSERTGDSGPSDAQIGDRRWAVRRRTSDANLARSLTPSTRTTASSSPSTRRCCCDAHGRR